MYYNKVQTEVNLPCTCLESFGSPVTPSFSFLYPYPGLPSFAEKKGKLQYINTQHYKNTFSTWTFFNTRVHKKAMFDDSRLD